MPRKKKSETETPLVDLQDGAAGAASASAGRTGAPTKSASAKRKKTSSTRKTAAGRKPKTGTKHPAAPAEPTDDQIRIRAYFIAERRHRFALPGDADSDWIEAKRQLLIEVQPR